MEELRCGEAAVNPGGNQVRDQLSLKFIKALVHHADFQCLAYGKPIAGEGYCCHETAEIQCLGRYLTALAFLAKILEEAGKLLGVGAFQLGILSTETGEDVSGFPC